MTRPPKSLSIFGLFLLIILSLTACNYPPATPTPTLPPPCTTGYLIASIDNANSNGPGTDTIDLDPGCIYQLDTVNNTTDGNNGLPSITSSIIINGNGATVRRAASAGKMAIRLFHISAGGELTLNNITLLDGMGIEPPDVTDPVRNSGGAIYNAGFLTVNDSLLTANQAKLKGGGIHNIGTMTLNNSTLEGNETNIGNEPNESGGAIHNAGTAAINNCTIANNTASQAGAGIANSGTLTVINSTISGNSTTIAGLASGAAIMNSGTANISYTTIANNIGTSSGSVWSAPDTIQISNSIIADNAPQDCSYPASSPISGPNLDSDGSCDSFTMTDDPQLGPLTSNGGPTMTHSLPGTSPAVDAASGSCPAADQRGEPRPEGPACDLGAFELGGGGPTPVPMSLISGLVFDDQNANGALDSGEPGLEGVELVLESGTCASPSALMTELSTLDGNYEFVVPAPSAGTYCLSIDPLTPPNDTILIPGEFTDPVGGELEFTLAEEEDLSELNFAWTFQFAGTSQENLVITDVTLSTTNPPDGGWVEVDVTIENQGSAAASGYELALIPHYGDGPPNPAGYALLPDLDPGDSHSENFTPGVLYTGLGAHTLRVLVTDDWYALGDPDSTGTAGDYEDLTITVSPAAKNCDPFQGYSPSLILLSVRRDTLLLPLYVDADGKNIPGMVDEDPPWEYTALLNDLESGPCGLQGFDDRLYCQFTLTPEIPGSTAAFELYLEGCDEPVFSEPRILIPELPPEEPECTKDLKGEECKAAGGEMSTGVTTAPYCICP